MSQSAGPLPGARTALVLLLLINFFNYVDRQVLAAVEVEIEKSFFPNEQRSGTREENAKIESMMGLLNTAFMVSYMLIAPLFGWLGDRMSRWILIGIGVILWSLASGASGLAATFAIMFLTRCFVGIGEGAYGPVAPAVISDMYPVEKRGAKLAWFYLAIPVGSACGYILGGQVFNFTGDWRWAFYVVVPPGILLGLLCFFMREPPRSEHRKSSIRDWHVFLKTPSYVFNTLGMTCMTFAMGAIAFWMPRYCRDHGAGDLAEVNMTFGLIVVLSGIGATLAGGWLGDRLKPRFPGSYFLVSAAGLFLGFPMILGVLYFPFPLAWVFVFLACFCLFFNTGPTNAIIANVTQPSLRSSAFALNILVIHIFGDVFSPSLVGYINGLYGMKTGFLVVSMFFVFGGGFWLLGSRYLAADTARAQGDPPLAA